MSPKKLYKVYPCRRNDIKSFIENNHYSGSINGCISDYCFVLKNSEHDVIGAMFYGRMAMAGQYKKFSNNSNEVIELRRLCCVDNTVKNTESYFIGQTLKWLKKNTDIKIVVSYADEEYGHTGIIYKASNFKYFGKSKGAKVIYYNGKKYHDKAIRTKYKGRLKPFASELKLALKEGRAYYKETKDKHCYVYYLQKLTE